MSRLHFLFLVLGVSQLCTAQDTFELLIEDEYDQMPTSVIETDEHYIFVELYRSMANPEFKTNLYKIDKQGHIKIKKEIKTGVYEFVITNLIDEGNSFYSGIGFQRVHEDSTANFTILKMDEEFSIVDEKNYQTGFVNMDYVNVERLNNGYLIVGSGKYTSFPAFHLFSYLLDNNYDTIRSKVYPEEGLIQAFDIIPSTDQIFFKLFTMGFTQQTPTIGQIVLLDTMLIRNTYTVMPEHVFFYMDAIYVDETHYLLSGSKHVDDEKTQTKKLALMRMNSSDVMQEIHLFGPDDTLSYPGFYSNLDFLDPNEIYYAGTKRVPSAYFSPTDSWFFLNKLNSTLDLQWQKFFGGDANYMLWGTIATQDGGCLLIGTHYDYITQINERDIYIIKVNEDGLIVGTGEEPGGIKIQDAIVYPNPGSEFLRVQSGPQIIGALFELFNLSGSLVLSTTLDERMVTIKTGAVKPGTYPYRVIYLNKIVANGKWVKQ